MPGTRELSDTEWLRRHAGTPDQNHGPGSTDIMKRLRAIADELDTARQAVSRVEHERDKWLTVVRATMDPECPKHGCDSHGHVEECGVAEIETALTNLLERAEAAEQDRNEQRRRYLAEAERYHKEHSEAERMYGEATRAIRRAEAAEALAAEYLAEVNKRTAEWRKSLDGQRVQEYGQRARQAESRTRALEGVLEKIETLRPDYTWPEKYVCHIREIARTALHQDAAAPQEPDCQACGFSTATGLIPCERHAPNKESADG